MSAAMNSGSQPENGSVTDPFEGVSGPGNFRSSTTFTGPGFDPTPEPPKEPEQGSQIPERLVEAGGALGRLARTTWKEGSEAMLEGGRQVAAETEKMVASGLEKISAKPEEQAGIVRSLVKVLPGIGPSTTYADAWRKWNEGVAKNDEAMKHDARKECLNAVADAGIDIALLGTGKLATGVARVARGVLGPLYLNRVGRTFGAANLDVVSTLADRVAKAPVGKRVAEYLLTRVKPSQDAEDIAAAAPQVQSDLEEIVNEEGDKAKTAAEGEKPKE